MLSSQTNRLQVYETIFLLLKKIRSITPKTTFLLFHSCYRMNAVQKRNWSKAADLLAAINTVAMAHFVDSNGKRVNNLGLQIRLQIIDLNFGSL